MLLWNPNTIQRVLGRAVGLLLSLARLTNPPAQRIYAIESESRAYAIDGESRIYAIGGEHG